MKRLAIVLLFGAASLSAQIDPDLLAGLKARSIGPASMSGRVASIDAVESNPNVIYVGAATGGLWKSTSGGTTWEPLFDDQPVHSIGAVAVFQAHPDIVWAGTGEGNPRNSVSIGNGIYRSLDGGRTWRHAGLAKTERIHRIVLHPTNQNVAWAAALGPLWGEGEDRGVFKTEDGGRTWRKVLYVDSRTGAADLVIDPSNPNKLFAAMWEHRRWPWFFHSGGPGSGLFVSHDGGETWKKYTEEDGMPKGNLGRIGIGIARSNPAIVYALVEAEKNTLIRSDDGGRSWKKVNEEYNVADRPFYYADIRVDPRDPNRIYSLASSVRVSNDGGKTWQALIPFRKIHPDHHAMWIDPNDPNHIIEGNDGGVAISHDRGATWRFVFNLPLGQYYHINVDMERPYNVYGGMQDNGSWRGPSSVWENGGIRNHHWQEVGFGDGFATLPVPSDPTRGYAMSQEGYLIRWDLRTGERKDIRPAGPDGTELRFNWNAAIAVDPFDADTVYYGSQFVHKSSNRGDAWTIISPDLTTNKREWQKQHLSGGLTPDVTGAENFTTIITIAPSAVERGVIWVGTDDGRVHVTRDGGASWTSVEANIKGVPPNTWVPHIEPSKFDAGTAWVVFDNHRRSDFAPYAFKTTDYGKTWTSIVTKDIRGYALVIEQDPVDRDLLFLGTEFALYASNDGGKNWIRLRHGLPTASYMALMVHPREHDLVIGTHGRAAYIIDDIRPLRTLTPEVMQKPIHLFDIPDAQQYRVRQTGGERFPGDGEFRGENRPYGALITFVLNAPDLPHPVDEKERERKQREREAKKKPGFAQTGVPQEAEKDVAREPVELKGEEEERDRERGPQVEITVTDESGTKIRTFRAPARQGLNRAVWNLRRDAFREPPRERPEWMDDPSGPEVLPGTYGITIRYKDQTASGKVHVLPDPRFDIAPAARQANWAAMQRAGHLQETLAEAIDRINRTRNDIDAVIARRRPAPKPGERPAPDALSQEGRALKSRLDAVEKEFWVPPRTKGIQPDLDAFAKINFVQSSLASSWDAPTAAQLAYLKAAETKLQSALDALNKLFAEDVAKFREKVRASGLQLFPETKPLAITNEP